MSTNQALAERLTRIAQIQDLLGADRFRAISNERAARTLEGLSFDVATLAEDRAALMKIDGIGPKIADKIIEFCKTGRIAELDELTAQVPPGLLPLLEIPGLGPKTVAVLWKQGGVTDLTGLHQIIASGDILKLPRMGAKSVERLKESMAMAAAGSERLAVGLALPLALRFVQRLEGLEGVRRCAYAGSLRRGRETVGDIDILVAADDPAAAKAAAAAFREMPEVRHIILAGDTKSSVRAAVGGELGRWSRDAKEQGEQSEAPTGPTIQVDLRIVPLESWGAALMYFTGSKEHNIELRERALAKGLTLNEYGLFPEDGHEEPPQKRGVRPVASKAEEEVYAALDLGYIPPEVRENRGELASAGARGGKTAAAGFDDLISVEEIKAELHAHTTASDGAMTITELAERAKARGFHTVAVTDHSRSSAIANGLSVDRLLTHAAAVHRANKEMKGITILAGSEVDILADGSLDYPDDVLEQLDVVVASPHTALSQNAEAATARLLRAIANPHVHILGHPTGRLINRRAGLSPDMAKIVAAAREHDVALEINAHWLRLDLRDTHVRAAVEAGCLVAINCDVHSPEDFENIVFGVLTGRRGWLRAEQCVNTWPAKRLHAWLARKRRR